jgi:DNA-binding transcriptional MerR regulator
MKKQEFTARDISKQLNTKVDTIKRWSRALLPPDPKAGRQSGHTRIFSIDETFLIYFASFLIRFEGFSISDCQKILKDLKPWLVSTGLWPSKIGPTGLKNMLFELFIQKNRGEDFFRYQSKRIISRNEIKEGSKRYREEYILGDIKRHKSIVGIENTKIIRIALLLVFFLKGIPSHNQE